MKKTFLVGGPVVSSLTIALFLGLLLLLSTPQAAQGQWQMNIISQDPDVLLIANYLGIDRKLKPVPGQRVEIEAPSGQPETEVTLTAIVRGQGILGLNSCNGVIATATTVKFKVNNRRTLTASDFTTSGGIGIENSTQTQKCVDDLSDKVTQGVGAAPPGNYILDLTLNLASTGAQLANASHTISIVATSAAEINLNLISPPNGDQITQQNPTFTFDAQKIGRLYVFEHNILSQSSQDAIRDLNSSLKCLDVAYNSTGTGQITYSYPGNALRPLQVNKKYTWFIQAVVSTGVGQSENRQSPLYTFTFTSSDPNYMTLLNALNNAPDPIGSTFANALSSGFRLNYSNTNQILMKVGDGPDNKIDFNTALGILNNLASGIIRAKAGITNQ